MMIVNATFLHPGWIKLACFEIGMLHIKTLVAGIFQLSDCQQIDGRSLEVTQYLPSNEIGLHKAASLSNLELLLPELVALKDVFSL